MRLLVSFCWLEVPAPHKIHYGPFVAALASVQPRLPNCVEDVVSTHHEISMKNKSLTIKSNRFFQEYHISSKGRVIGREKFPSFPP